MKNPTVSVVQATPILFDLENSIKKIEYWTEQASKENPDLVLFPEAFLPGYPRGLTFGTKVGDRSASGRETWLRFWENSLSVPGAYVSDLSEIAKKYNTWLVIGVVEKGDSGSLYCSVLYFNNEGTLVGKHRKLKPTAAERIIWGEGDGSDLEVYKSEFGKISGLICWENYMPLARTFLYEKGVQIYLAPTADQRDNWQHSLKHIAVEGRCFVLGCNQYVEKKDYPDLPGEDISEFGEIMCKGGSVIVDPLGNTIAGPLWDKQGILTAELDMSLIAKAKLDFDAVGHYARNDVFKLNKLK
ncbi:carbon-nitrogen hydrolase family protein [bacterium]|jgi:nitrilase|nr:carbon-nitrogen hydrolase family protein [bacterium]